MAIKEKDFVEIEYTGKLKDEDLVFDTTDEKLSKEAGIFSENTTYGPVVVCIGEGQLLKGLDKGLMGKEAGKEYTVDIQPEDGFGKKKADLIHLIGTSKFKKEGINPAPGMQVNVDGALGIIKTVTGGRTLVDFNHPLSSKELVYTFKVNKIVEDDLEKASAYLKVQTGAKDVTATLENNELKVKIQGDIPEEFKEKMNEKLTGIIPTIKKVTFSK
jgi:FKBP-type peptidyl-prolyl cis-trans isomerase 2